MPIFNATIDGQYPIKAGLRGLPAGEADSSFPEIMFLGPNAPTQWRGTDARAFTEYLNNYTLQNNLSWTRGKHAITFGLQAQRMDADERERTYGSLATFGFSNLQTAGFGPTGTLDTANGNAYASYLLGELNATNVIQDSEVATSGRFYTYAFWVQDDYKLRPNLSLNLGLRYDIMKPYTELYDRWSYMDPTMPNPAVGGYPGAMAFAGDGPNSCQCRTPIKTYYGAIGPRLGLAYSVSERTVFRAAYGINYSRRGAVGGRAGARNGTGTLGFSANASFPSPNASFAPAYNWNDGVPAYAPPPFFDPSLNTGFVTGRGTGGTVTYGDSEIGGRMPRYQNWNAGVQYALTEQYHRRRVVCGQPRRFSRWQRPRVLREPDGPEVSCAWKPSYADRDAGVDRGGPGHRAGRRASLSELLRHHFADAAAVSTGTRGSPTYTATWRNRPTTRSNSQRRNGDQTTACRWVSTTHSAGRKTTCRHARAMTSIRTGPSARTISRTC